MPSPSGYRSYDEEVRQCNFCGTEFVKTTHNRTFCSRKCFNEDRREKRKRQSVCVICGETYIAKTDACKTCSAKCRGISSRQNVKLNTHTCVMCGVEYQTKAKKSQCCSQTCQNARAFANRDGDPKKYFQVLLSAGKVKNRPDRKNLGVDTLLEILEEQEGLCAITGVPLTFSSKLGQGRINTNASIDRIDSSKGYTEDNIHIVCDIVNRMKLDMSMEEFMFWCKKVTDI